MSLTKLTVDDMKEMTPALIPDAAHMSCAPEELKAVLGSLHRNKYEEKLGRAAAMVQCFCKKTIERYRRLLKETNEPDKGKKEAHRSQQARVWTRDVT
jgi:hypothetical protein